tara:strand:- start:247 stop:8121 length:7875 start_codon:yes stop_codon:yes gene_type:complete
MNSIQRLYKALVEQKLVNISFDQFSKYYENDKYKQQVFSVIKDKGMFEGDFNSFSNAYSVPKAKPRVDKNGNDIMVGGESSQEENTWIEDSFGKNTVTDFVGDLYRGGKQGWAAGQSVDEALEIYKKGRNLSDEDLQAFLDANKKMQEAGVSDEMLSYQKMYEENGGGMWGAIKAFAANPTIAPSVIVSSMSQMLSSAIDSEEVRGAAAASSGVGAAAGAAIGSTGFSLGPLGALTTAGGAISGAVGGFFGGLTGAMETGNTLAQLLQGELGEGVEMTKENVRAILEDADKFQDLKNKAVARGLTIGAIEGVTAGLTKGLGSVALKGAKTISKSGKVVDRALTATQKTRLATGAGALEMTAGAGGEALGQLAAGQELDASEIFLEGVAEAKGVLNLGNALTKKSYMMNGDKASRKDIEAFFNDPKISNADKAKVDIEIIGDKSLQTFVNDVKNDADIEVQIDARIEGKERAELVSLEKERRKAEVKSKRKGVFAVPGAKVKLENIEKQINEIIGRYEGVDLNTSTDADVQARLKEQKVVRTAQLTQMRDKVTKKVKETKAYKDMDINSFEGSQDEIVDRYVENMFENANYDLQILEAELEGHLSKGDTKKAARVKEMIAEKEQVLENINQGFEINEEGKKVNIKEGAKGAFGFLIEDNATGKLTMVFNNDADISGEKGFVNVAAHEFLHAVLRKTFFQESDVAAGITETKGVGIQTGEKLISHLLESGEVGFLTEITERLKSYGQVDKDGKIKLNDDMAAQEVMNLLSDSMVEEMYKAENESWYVKLGSIITEHLESVLPAKYKGKLKFENGKQVFDFVKTFGRAVAGDKAAGRVIARAAKEGVDAGKPKGATQTVSKAPKSSVIQEKVDGFALNEDGSKMTKSEYDAKGAIDAYMYLISDQNIDALIKRELVKEGIDISADDANVNGVPIDEFLERVRERITPEILGFDPGKETTTQGKFGLSGFVNGRIKWRVGDVSNKAKKELSTGSLDKEVGGDGKMTAADFIADEQSATMEDFENQDQSIFAEQQEERGVVNSEYRQQLKSNDGKKFIAPEQEESVRQGVRDVVNSQDTQISEDDFMLKFENNVKKTMKNIVQKAMGTGNSYKQFIINNIDAIIEYSTVQDLVALERLLDGAKFEGAKKIFSVKVKENISPTEVDKAIEQGKIKPDVNRTSGPDLYEKRTPTKSELEAYFFGKTSEGVSMQEEIGYTVGRSTLGTRKDGLSRMIIATLSLDAVMETIQEPAVMQSAMVFSPNIDVDVQIQDLARKVNRGINTQFSLTSIEKAQALDLQKIMTEEGRLGASISSYVRNNNIPKKVLYAAYEGYMSRRADKMQGILKLDGVKEIYNRIRRKKQFKTVDLETGKLKTVNLEGSEKVHTTLERIVIENLVSAIYSGKANKNVSVILAAPMEGGMPDAYIRVNVGQTSSNIGIEIKGQISKTPSKNVNFRIENGKLVEFSIAGGIESIGQENYDIIKGMFDTRIMKLFNKDKYKKITKNFGTDKITQAQYEVLRDSGLKGELASLIEMIELDYVQRMYEKKKIPSQYIDIGIKGTFHFSEDVLDAKTKPFTTKGTKDPKTGKPMTDERRIPLSARFGFSVNRKTKANIDKPESDHVGRLVLRVEGELNEGLFEAQEIKLKEPNGAKKLVSNIPFSKINAKQRSKNQNTINEAYNKARLINADTKTKGISIFDFDETVGISENFIIATKGKETKRIASNEWPFVGDVLASEGWNFDFTDFNKVTKGKPGPLMQKLKNQIKKYGVKDVYILTARAPESQKAIHDWLKTQGINLPYENITGLGNSTGDAKAMWILDKYANENYNDIYFVDDAMPNVEAVKHVMDQLDIKSKSVQARIQFSKGMSAKFNIIIQQNKDVDASKMFSDVSAGKFGKRNNPFRFFVPPSADDFLGLLRYFIGKGKVGEAQMNFFKRSLIDPFARAYKEMNSAKMAILKDFKELMKQFPDIKKKLGKLIPGSEYTYDNAVRVYLFNKAGHSIPGISDAEVAELSNVVTSDPELLAFAETLSAISRVKEGYSKPSENWDVENISMDMQNAVDKIGRAKYLEEWQANVDEIFSKDNLNKVQAVYGNDVREALEDMLYAMKTGRSRPQGSNRIANAFMNWINNSVGAIMFVNMRSAVLQLLSIVNFTNFEENNIFAQAKMFANQKQFWADFSFIFNSDYLQARRSGLKMNINEAELQNAVAGATNKALAALRYILSLGFTPTQVADSIAIAFGGGNFYRSKLNKYLAEGMSQTEAQEKAFLDFQEIAEETQQSARPDKISQQQRSVIGRIILNFANTPLQMARLTKKAAQDLVAGRGSWKANVSRILYYGFVQNLIFASLQQALFAIGFDEEEDDEKKQKKQDTKIERIFNGAFDSLLRGSGIYGAVIATVKNTAYKFMEEREKGFKGDLGNVIVEAINLSPSIGSKFRKLYSAMKNDKYNKHVYDRMGYGTLENPVYQSISLAIEGTTNIPINRLLRKIDNIKASTDSELHTVQRIFVALGWDQWSLGIDSRKEVDEVKDEIKKEKKQNKQKDKQQKKADLENQYEKDQKKEVKQKKKNITCSAAKSNGDRCNNKPVKNGKCTIHEKVEVHPTGKYIQCRKRKSDGNRCKVQTNSKSGFCYYHD